MDTNPANLAPLPWRAIVAFDALFYTCGFLVIRGSLLLHEFAHVATARLYGGEVYAIYFPPVPWAFLASETGLTFARTFEEDMTTNYILGMAGLAAQVFVAALAWVLARRPRANSLWHVFLMLLAGVNTLDASLYVISGFYSNRGDFTGIMAATEPYGKYLFSLMFVTCAVAAYYLARWYLVLQDGWLGAGTTRRRAQLALLTAGPAFAGLLTSQMLKGRVLGTVVVILYCASGAIAIRATEGSSPLSLPAAPWRRVAALLLACIGMEGFLAAHQGLLRLPDRVYASEPDRAYRDAAVSSLPESTFSMGIGPDGTLYYADAEEGTLRSLDPANGAGAVLLEGLLNPRRVQVANGGVYVVETGDQNHLSRILRYDPATKESRTLLDELYWPYCLFVAPNGDVYFNEGGRFFFVLRHDATERKLLLSDYPEACALVVDSDGTIYAATGPNMKTGGRGALMVHTKQGWRERTSLPGTLFPKAMTMDAAGSLYIAGEGYSSITRVAKDGDSLPVTVRGSYCVSALAFTPDGALYYIAQEKPVSSVRVLRK